MTKNIAEQLGRERYADEHTPVTDVEALERGYEDEATALLRAAGRGVDDA